MVENTLAQVYKEKGEQPDTFRGGPAYYIEKGLGPHWKWLSVTFSIFLLMCYGFVFNAVQSNAIASAMNDAWEINPLLVGFAVALIAAIIVFGGIPFDRAICGHCCALYGAGLPGCGSSHHDY